MVAQSMLMPVTHEPAERVNHHSRVLQIVLKLLVDLGQLRAGQILTPGCYYLGFRIA